MTSLFFHAIEALTVNRSRFGLALLGLTIGMAAIISVFTIGQGLAAAVNGMVSGLTDNELFVHPDDRQSDHVRGLLRLSEMSSLQGADPHIVVAFPSVRYSERMAVRHAVARLQYSAAPGGQFGSLPMLYGRFFSDGDLASGAHVAILSYDAFMRLWPEGTDMTGQIIRIGSRDFVVVGVLSKKPAGLVNIDFDSAVHLPYTTMEHDYLRGARTAVEFLLDDPRYLASVKASLKARLEDMRPGLLYQMEDKGDITTLVDNLFDALTAVLMAIGTIAVFVAGVGIMNVMLITINERTREIGICRAVGAKSHQILLQIFMECGILTVLGVIIGTAVGVAFGWFVGNEFISRLSGAPTPLPIGGPVTIAIVYSVTIVMAFGLYPAYRAARLDPIQALRYE